MDIINQLCLISPLDISGNRTGFYYKHSLIYIFIRIKYREVLYTKRVRDLYTQVLIMSESPVTSINKVEERTAYSEAYKELLTSNYEYYFDSDADAVIRTTKNGERASWAKGEGAVRITYKAGYSSTPKDLQLAIFDLVTYYLKDEHKARQTLGGASIQNQSTAGLRNSTDFPDHIKRVLDLYRVVI